MKKIYKNFYIDGSDGDYQVLLRTGDGIFKVLDLCKDLDSCMKSVLIHSIFSHMLDGNEEDSELVERISNKLSDEIVESANRI